MVEEELNSRPVQVTKFILYQLKDDQEKWESLHRIGDGGILPGVCILIQPSTHNETGQEGLRCDSRE